jgi:hypothetical protein
LKAALQRTLDAIDGVHFVPQNLPDIPVKVVARLPKQRDGEYNYYTSNGAPASIRLLRNQDSISFSFAHEVGHYLDMQALSTQPAQYASDQMSELVEWRRAVQQSQGYKKLQQLQAGPRAMSYSDLLGNVHTVVVQKSWIRYALQGHELFARSYAQWIAIRSGDAELLRALRIVQQRSLTGLGYAEQWQDADFEPIAKALDALVGGSKR